MDKETLDVKSFAALMAKFDGPAKAGDPTEVSINLEKGEDNYSQKLLRQTLDDELNKIE